MKKYLVSISFLGIITLSGCAHGAVEKRLDEKLAQEPILKTRTELHVEADRLIETAPGLSEEQRKMLRALRDSTRVESERLRVKSWQLRAVLIKDLMSANYRVEEVDLLKTKMKDVEHESLHLFFGTLREANTILGRWKPQQDEAFYDQMMLITDPRDL